jgi:hypothetical protein
MAADALVRVGACRKQEPRAGMPAIAELWHAQQARMRDRDKRWQLQRTDRAVDPIGIGVGRLTQDRRVPDRAGEIRAARREIGAFGEQPRGDQRSGAIEGPVDIAGVDQLQPMENPRGTVLL